MTFKKKLLPEEVELFQLTSDNILELEFITV